MAVKTTIEWTDATWNPVRGCSRVSEGCRNCYAERTALRFAEGPFFEFVTKVNGHAAWTGKVELVEEHLTYPLHWRAPRRIFVNSMSDLFHEVLPDSAIDQVFAVMARASHHTYQILTKRPRRMLEYMLENAGHAARGRVQDVLDQTDSDSRSYSVDAELLFDSWPLPNVWLGVSVEDQETADVRIPLLLKTPAARRFVSYEPALGAVNFTALQPNREVEIDALNGRHGVYRPLQGTNTKIDWLIVGGESGPGARPFDIAWARNTIAQCKAAGVACFVKQLGAFYGSVVKHDKNGGAWNEWPEDLRVREFPR